MPDRDMLFREAIGLATAEEMRRDDTVFVMGEDVGGLWRHLQMLRGPVRGIRRGARHRHPHCRGWAISVSASGLP